MKDPSCCDEPFCHQTVLDALSGKLPERAQLYDLAELFKIFGDETRVRLLTALCEHELCVCDLTALLALSQSAVSHQLRVLKQARLVRSRRAGKAVFYALSDDHVRLILQQGMAHVTE